MFVSFLYLIPSLLILSLLSWYKTKYGLFFILAALPTFLIRTKIFFIPSTLLELSIYTVFVVYLIRYLKKFISHYPTIPLSHYLKNDNLFNFFKLYGWPISLFFIAAVISTLISTDLRLSAGILKAWFFDPLLFLIIFVSEGRNISNIETKLSHQYKKHSIYALILGAVAIGLYGLFEYVIGFGLHIAGRIDSVFVSPNYLSMYLVPVSLLAMGLIIYPPKRKPPAKSTESFFRRAYNRPISAIEKIFLYFSLIILLVSIYLTKSYSGWLALLVGMSALWLSLPKRKIKYILLIIGLIFFLPIMIYEGSVSHFRHYDDFWQITSKDTRMIIWQAALSTGIHQPILGVGLGGFRQAYQEYIKTLPKLPPEREVPFPHNLYLNLWLEMGILGMVSFLWLIIIFFYQLLKREQNQAKNYFNIVIAVSMLSILVHGFTDTTYFKNDLSLLFWFLLGYSVQFS